MILLVGLGRMLQIFFLGEYQRGAIPQEFLPLQSGVGNIANAVLGALGADKKLPAFSMYTEVIGDHYDLMMQERMRLVPEVRRHCLMTVWICFTIILT